VTGLRGFAVLVALAAFGCNDHDTTVEPACRTEAGPALDPSHNHVVVVGSLSEDWTAVNTDGGLHRVGSGLAGRSPNDADLIGGLLYVVNSLDNAVQVIDPATGATVGCIALGAGANPWELRPDPGRADRAYVTTFLGGQVLELDLSARTVLRRATVGAGLEGLLVTDTRVLVTLTGYAGSEGVFGQGYVVVLDKATLAETARLPVPTNPQFLLEVPDGGVHVICTGNFGNPPPAVYGTVARLTPDLAAVRDTLPLGGSPFRADVAPDGTVYVAAFYGGLLAYDANAFHVLRGPEAPIEGSAGYAAVAVAGDRVYAVNFDLDALVVVDTATQAVVNDLVVGDGPVAVVWIPAVPVGPNEVHLDRMNAP